MKETTVKAGMNRLKKKNDAEKVSRFESKQAKCDAVYACNKEVIYKIALDSLSGDGELALEVTEKAFSSVFRRIDELDDATSDKTKAFLTAALRAELNILYEEARKRVGIPSEFNKIYITKQERFNVEQVLIRNEMITKLAIYVENLSYREREILFYHYFMGWSTKMLGRYMRISEEDMESCIFQIKKKIAEMMLGEDAMEKVLQSRKRSSR